MQKKMNVRIFSKSVFERTMDAAGITSENISEQVDHCFILIYNNSDNKEKPLFGNYKENVLTMYFDDCQNNGYIMNKYDKLKMGKHLTKTNVDELVKFIRTNKRKKYCFIQSENGISRAGAVGLFVHKYFHGTSDGFFKSNPSANPNELILNQINEINERCQLCK